MGPAVHGVVAPQHSTRGITATQAQARFVGCPMGPRPALHGHNHPLAIARVATVMELARLLGWLDADDFQASPEATLEQLAGFHNRPYLAALRRADALQQVEPAVRQLYNIGTLENPVFPGVFRQAALFKPLFSEFEL